MSNSVLNLLRGLKRFLSIYAQLSQAASCFSDRLSARPGIGILLAGRE
ncbi:MAG TPA: hypothetical protein VIQ31_22580 [Phormidium sp.]